MAYVRCEQQRIQLFTHTQSKRSTPIIQIYTDGSCDPAKHLGAWAAIILGAEEETVIKGTETTASHNAMELLAAVKALEHVEKSGPVNEEIILYSDSQYVVNLVTRMDALIENNFVTGKGTQRKNTELLKLLFPLIKKLNPDFVKVPAHQKKTDQRNYNREVDKLVRHMVRRG